MAPQTVIRGPWPSPEAEGPAVPPLKVAKPRKYAALSKTMVSNEVARQLHTLFSQRATRGLPGLSLEQIANRLDMTKEAIRYYVPGKVPAVKLGDVMSARGRREYLWGYKPVETKE